MAIQTNTTKTIGKTSTVLGKKCEATKKNMTALLKKAGVKDATKTVSVMIPLNRGEKDDVVFVGLNGVDFYLKRGETYDLAAPIVEILKNTGNL